MALYAMILIHDILPIQCLEELVFTPTIKDVLSKYIDGMMSVGLSPINHSWNLRYLHSMQHNMRKA